MEQTATGLIVIGWKLVLAIATASGIYTGERAKLLAAVYASCKIPLSATQLGSRSIWRSAAVRRNRLEGSRNGALLIPAAGLRLVPAGPSRALDVEAPTPDGSS
jgi:hypothetical protein